MTTLMILIVIAFVVNGIDGYNTFDFSFESHTCQSPAHPLNPSTSEVIILSYDGGSISCDHVAFSVLNDPDLLTFELMINPLYHEDPDCSTVLEYRTSLIKKALKTYNCTNIAEDRFTTGMTRNSTFYVQIHEISPYKERARFKLKMLPMGATFSTEDAIAIISGATIGAILLLSLIGFGVCLFRKKSKK
uniref:Uncharacterized protein LOC111109210 n=1 Tax=Crassostrea virginica TaxID=6565 RepID=A0A8B8BC47_CRAVI|nr:uncharacterized protein LOC111109210 [Crassostrea virginica]